MSARLRCVLLCASLLLASGHAWAAGWEHLGNVDRVQELKDGVELSAGKARIRVTFFLRRHRARTRGPQWRFSQGLFLGHHPAG